MLPCQGRGRRFEPGLPLTTKFSFDIARILTEYQQQGITLSDIQPIKSGKEADVYVATCNEARLALKVYRYSEHRLFRNRSLYLEGKFFRKASERKAVSRKNRFAKNLIEGAWVRREYYLLDRLYKAAARVPRVFAWTKESILMEFIGDLEPASRLIDLHLSQRQARESLELVLQDIERFLAAGIIHGDLSPYNILWWRSSPYVIDFPQALDIRSTPHYNTFLLRDISNVLAYFEELTPVNRSEIYQRFQLEYPEAPDR